MQHLDPNSVKNEIEKRVWSVRDFAKRNSLDRLEEVRLLQLFGPFATASELQHNVKRSPRCQ
ncbi:hypothetical protein LH464_22875 [Neorhizobium sp. T786]|uniref:hypothetical protein n=1 Tax=Pseudorhizobium xiangyangii TaxID=2883104 RepID=UPI001CFFEF12|nr:hypothetical protein [Neorhizobium xiangyangii]